MELASTTLPFSNSEPDQTSISLFTFVPDDEALNSKFPDEQLVFLKIATSISPASFPRARRPSAERRSAKAFPVITCCSI